MTKEKNVEVKQTSQFVFVDEWLKTDLSSCSDLMDTFSTLVEGITAQEVFTKYLD